MTSLAHKTMALLLGLGVATVTLSSPGTASACGGFFCSRTPVDQTAERIIFTVNGDDTVTAHVQIQYFGERDAFAWIVPVPEVPELDTFPGLAMPALDLATEPRYWTNSCIVAEAAPSAGAGDGGGDSNQRTDDGVMVLQREAVGPFDTVTLQGDSAEELIDWLRDNDYRLTDAMIPFIQKYVDDGLKFLAMKLLPDADVSDIEPISMTYEAEEPMIPIRLTTVAAQPEMGVVVWVFANQRYGPKNYFDLDIDDRLIKFDSFGSNNNYLTVVSREVDRRGGHAMVTEYAQGTQDLLERFSNQGVPNDPDAQAANQAVIDLLNRFPYVTRLYTRMSAEEMTVDPVFERALDQSDVSNLHDLSYLHEDSCGEPPPPPDPCDLVYCGRQGVCVELADGAPACVCAEGATARPTTTTVANRADLYCEPLDFNFMEEMDDDFPDACDGFDCGQYGECVTMNGNPTCRCEVGYAAKSTSTFDPTTARLTIQLSCEEVDGVVPPLPLLPAIGEADLPDPDELGDPESSGGSSGSSGCTLGPVSPSAPGSVGSAAFLLALVALGRRRQR